MKRKTSYCLCLALCLAPLLTSAIADQQKDLDRAMKKVDNLFKDLQYLSTHKDGGNTSSTRLRLTTDYWARSTEGANNIDTPNEFRQLNFSESYKYEGDISPARHIGLFQDMFRDEGYDNCSFSYNILPNRCQLINEAEYKKGEAPASFALVVVQKTYRRGYKVMRTFTDSLQLDMNTLTVCAWSNDASTHHMGFSSTETIEQMHANAALAYSRKQYDRAYGIYEAIVAANPEEGDAYYRMAVMLYKKEHGKSMGRKYRNTLILDYLNLATKKGSYLIRSCADNMRYWITC